MRYLLVMVLGVFSMINVSAEIRGYSNNNASTGRIIIDGYDMGTSASVIKGSGVKHTLERKVSGFSSVITDSQFDIIYRDGTPSLLITGDKNIITHVLSTVENGKLTLSIEKSYSSYHPIVINISSNKIESVTLEGAGTLILKDIKTDKLTLNSLGTVDIVASGVATRLELNIQGTGDVKARGLQADDVSVNLEGTGDIEITANRELDADISGVGDIVVFGNPKKINKHMSGVGDIEIRE